MAKFVYVFAVVALCAISANALKCYDCPLGCEGDDAKKWKQQDCGEVITGQEKVCLKQVVTKTGGPTRVVRKCVIQPTGKQFQCVDAPGEKSTECNVCDKDLCNSAGSVSFSFLALASVVLPFLAARYY